MRQVREVLRLKTAEVGLNEIARRIGVAPSTVRLTLKRLARAGFSWPLPAEMTDAALEAALFAAAGTKQGHRRHAEPDWAELHRELKRKHVTVAASAAGSRAAMKARATAWSIWTPPILRQ
jgi:transposase